MPACLPPLPFKIPSTATKMFINFRIFHAVPLGWPSHPSPIPSQLFQGNAGSWSCLRLYWAHNSLLWYSYLGGENFSQLS